MKRKQGVRSLTRVPRVQVAHPVARIPGPERKADTAFADCARLKQQDSSDCVQGCRQRDAPGAGCSGQGPDGVYTSEQNARCQARPKLIRACLLIALSGLPHAGARNVGGVSPSSLSQGEHVALGNPQSGDARHRHRARGAGRNHARRQTCHPLLCLERQLRPFLCSILQVPSASRSPIPEPHFSPHHSSHSSFSAREPACYDDPGSSLQDADV
jgi:hypothetical protein